MAYFNLDIVLFSFFLLSNLILGLRAGRNVKTLQDYAIGKKDFSTATITSTLIATWIGGGFLLQNLQYIYTDGLKFIIVAMGGPLCLLFIGQVLAGRMGEFLNSFSVAEAMGDLYGKAVRIITAISGVLLGVGYTAIQFEVISRILTILLHVEGVGVTITAASIVIIYSAFGGIRSVTITDVFQFMTFSIIIPIIALVIWTELKDPGQVLHTVTTNPIFSIRQTVGWNMDFLRTLMFMLFFVIPGMYPFTFQRVAISKSVQQVKKSNIYSAGIVFLITIIIAWVAILLLAANPHLEADKLINYIIDSYAYPGLKGMIALGITAMAMSTADSHLNASAVLVIHDIIKPFKPSFKESMWSIRLSGCIAGIMAMLLAFYIRDLLKLVLWGAGFYMPIVTVPLLLAIFGFRSSTRAVLIGMAAGLLTTILWGHFMAYTGINNVIPGMLANIIFFMGSHYILKEPGGWVGIKNPGPLLAARQARRDAWKSFLNAIKRPQLYTYLQKNLPSKESLYALFGLYVMGATYALFFTVSEDVVADCHTLYDVIAHSVLFVIFIFLTYPAWPPTFKQKWFITFAWPLGIFYALFVVGSMLVMMSGFNQVQVMIFMLNLVIAALLLTWPLVLLLSLSGMLVAYLVFYLTACDIPLVETTTVMNGTLKFSVIYMLLLFSSFLIALVRFKQSKIKLADKNTYLLTNQEASKDQLVEVLQYRNELFREMNEEQRALFDSTTAAYVQQAIYRITDYLRLEVSKFNIGQLWDQVKSTLQLQDLDIIPQLISKNHTHVKIIQADLNKITQLIVDSILYIDQHNPTHTPITLGIEDAKLGHTVDHIKEYTRKMSALKITITTGDKLTPTQDLYMVSPTQTASLNPQNTSEPNLLENLRIIDAHYGYADVNSIDTHVYVLPVDIREVRGKVMELLREPAIVDPEELKHPLAVDLEQKLFDKLRGTTVDLTVIKKALDTIKKYHSGVRRKSGEPFFTHPMQVALILMDYTKDQDAILGALLHDTVEDTSLSLIHIKTMFGEEVAELVNKATNLEDKIRKVNLREHETIYRLMDIEDRRAALVKLSDRLHNMRTIQGHSSLGKRKHIANETLLFFVPMAKQLDLTAMAQELEKLCLDVLGQ